MLKSFARYYLNKLKNLQDYKHLELILNLPIKELSSFQCGYARMRVGILGINHKLANLKLRESLAQCCQRRFGADNSSHGGNRYFVLLSTCNRTEIYFSSEDLAETHTYILNILRQDVEAEFDQKLYSYFGWDCFWHLCRVITGLDSAIVGETEIQGQVKCAYEYATTYIALSEPLHYLFQKSLKVGKHVRSALPMQRGLPDLEHAILTAGMQTFTKVQDVKVLFVGASDINRKILSFFKNKHFRHITVCNRSSQVAFDLAAQYGLKVLEWRDLDQWITFDWVIFGTKASGYLANWHVDCLDKTFERKLIMDLCVPRNVNPDIVKLPGVILMNIDEIIQTLSMRHEQLSHIITEAEELIGRQTRLQAELRNVAEIRRYELLESGYAAMGST